MKPQRVIIMGAAGRDFHNFNVYFRGNPDYHVVAFTAAQIPSIEGRIYPAELAGEGYPEGIPIHAEDDLAGLIRGADIDQVVFAYSDVSHEFVMHRASEVLTAGADFRLMGLKSTSLRSSKPVITVCATRTGSGKSQTSRKVASILRERGFNAAVIRHPMPYGDLKKQVIQRFASFDDLDRYQCSIEEREEYEPHLAQGILVYAGLDYEAILREAESEVDIILWDGGNNDLPFLKSDLHIVVVDPHRPGHELTYYPGESNLLAAEVVIINKVDTAKEEDVELVRNNVRDRNPSALIVTAASPIHVDDQDAISGQRVLVVEDGPTLTHGGMAYGAAWIAAQRFGAAEIVDPRPYADGSIAEVYADYPTTGDVLPAMGYGESQQRELKATIERVDADLVLIGTPIDLGRLLEIDKPYQRVRYELEEIGQPTLSEILDARFGSKT